ncbi:MAG: thioredoxin [Candidatus Omnitrophota bacterium]
MGTTHLTEQNFKAEVINSKIPVLVDFWAEWCGPCRMIAPIIDELAKDLNGRLKVTKLNVDEAQALAAEYNIMSIPTILIFKGGELVEEIVGAMSKEQMLEKINPQIS